MLRSILGLLAVGAVFVDSKKCVDGKDNVIKIYDTTKGKGKILVKDLEIGTYDKYKKPICSNGKPQFTFPGHFKPVKEGKNKLMLEISLEKNSFMIGVVCDKGVSKNQFVPSEINMNLCEISSLCGMLGVKTPSPLAIAPFLGKEFVDFGPLPIPQLGGEWKMSVNLVQGGKKVAGLRVGTTDEWLAIESLEDDGTVEMPEEGAEEHEESETVDHEEL
ncbi:hypothetical protein OSTOST_16453 [Ostertagia ostertagi]